MTYTVILPHPRADRDPATGLWVARPQPGRVLVDADTRERLLYPTAADARRAMEALGYAVRGDA